MKKIAVLALVAAMSLSLVACGKEPVTDNGDNNNSQQVNTEQTEQIEQTEVSETDEGDSQQVAEGTAGQILAADFLAQLDNNNEMTAQELADALIANPIIPFAGATMEVEPGYLSGFGETEITGFSEGYTFGPMIGSIPFVGYVFTLEEGTDAEQFMALLRDNADFAWNICVEAEEMQMEQSGDKIFFVMCKTDLESN